MNEGEQQRLLHKLSDVRAAAYSPPPRVNFSDAQRSELEQLGFSQATIENLTMFVSELKRSGPKYWEGRSLRDGIACVQEVAEAARLLQSAMNKLDANDCIFAAERLGGTLFGLRFKDDLEAVQRVFASRLSGLEGLKAAGQAVERNAASSKADLVRIILGFCKLHGVAFNTSEGSPFRKVCEAIFSAAGMSDVHSAVVAFSKLRELKGTRKPGGKHKSAGVSIKQNSVFDTSHLK